MPTIMRQLADGSVIEHEFEPSITETEVNAERDRRLLLDFEFQGVMFQRDETSLKRINGMGTLALGAIQVEGAQPGDLYWSDPAKPFGWIASDNSVMPMDAQTMWAFGKAAAAVESRLVFAAKTLREMDPIPDDFATHPIWDA